MKGPSERSSCIGVKAGTGFKEKTPETSILKVFVSGVFFV